MRSSTARKKRYLITRPIQTIAASVWKNSVLASRYFFVIPFVHNSINLSWVFKFSVLNLSPVAEVEFGLNSSVAGY
jgi:hypothetical protein